MGETAIILQRHPARAQSIPQPGETPWRKIGNMPGKTAGKVPRRWPELTRRPSQNMQAGRQRQRYAFRHSA